jgi:hypothetical protein
MAEALEELWQTYIDAERKGIRADALRALAAAVDALLELPRDERHSWVLRVASDFAGDNCGFPLRTPLFRKVILPELAAGTLAGEPSCARLLAHFDQFLLRVGPGECALPEALCSRRGLLAEALRLEPSDSRARAALVEWDARYLVYTLHELPSGVLYGHDGASVDQCEELLQLLEEFKDHVSVLGRDDDFKALIADCAFHYQMYRQYLLVRPAATRYEQFLLASRSGA